VEVCDGLVVAVFAGLLEVGWAVGLKYTEGFTRPIPTLLTMISMIASLGLLGLSLKILPLGTAYAIWTGVGTLGTAVLGIVLLGESGDCGTARLHRANRDWNRWPETLIARVRHRIST